jgi:hypothetical protein
MICHGASLYMVNWSGCLNRNPLYPKGVFDYYPFQGIGLRYWLKLMGFIFLLWSVHLFSTLLELNPAAGQSIRGQVIGDDPGGE